MHLSCDTDPTANLAHCHYLPHALLVRKYATSQTITRRLSLYLYEITGTETVNVFPRTAETVTALGSSCVALQVEMYPLQQRAPTECVLILRSGFEFQRK